jgi:hypothetical protein
MRLVVNGYIVERCAVPDGFTVADLSRLVVGIPKDYGLELRFADGTAKTFMPAITSQSDRGFFVDGPKHAGGPPEMPCNATPPTTPQTTDK